MPNAANNVTVPANTTGLVIFATPTAAAKLGLNTPNCQDADGVLGLTVYNSGAEDAEIQSDDFHPTVTGWLSGTIPADLWGPLPAGKSVTLEYRRDAGSSAGQIDHVKVRMVDSSKTTTIGWLVTARGPTESVRT